MVWDAKTFGHALRDAVDSLDTARASALCKELVGALEAGSATPAEKEIKHILQELRRKRLFWLLESVAAAYLATLPGREPPPLVQLQLIQGLIDQGKLMEAEVELLDLADRTSVDEFTGREARGLIGRVNKQAYANARVKTGKAATERLQEAIGQYRAVYQRDPDENWWHGINVVACLARAQRDGIPAAASGTSEIDWKSEARRILERVASYTVYSGDYTWATATAMEACVALEDAAGANLWCERYIRAPYADVFELGSTERQLREIWQLDGRTSPASSVLRAIQGRLGQLGGSLGLASNTTGTATSSLLTLQAQLGSEATRAVLWLERICRRADSVALITKDTDDRVSGTGFLVNERDIGATWGEGLVLVTNAHVVSPAGEPAAMAPDRARVRLTRRPTHQEIRLRDVLCWSAKHDVSICAMDKGIAETDLAKLGLPVGRTGDLRVADGARKARLYVVGHPSGAALQISLYDNFLIDVSESEGRVRYRSPTQEGSSGSPVLSEELEVVAIHHATRNDQEANQGVLIDVLRTLIRECPPGPAA